MQAKGYSSIEDFRGKLKPYAKHTSRLSKSSSATAAVTNGTNGAASAANSVRWERPVIFALLATIAYLLAEKFGLVK